MLIPFRALIIFGFALSILSAAPASAQTTPAENPFGGATQGTTPAPKRTRAAAATALKPGQFRNEADAKANCPGETVVWVNIGTKVYHQASATSYGKTKRGAYMCEKDTAAAGFRAAKNEKKS